MSRDSGAGAYSQGTARSGLCSPRDWSVSRVIRPSIDREVVGSLVGTGALLVDLHEDVVEQRRCADPKQVGRHPVWPQRLVEQHQILDGLLRLADSSGNL